MRINIEASAEELAEIGVAQLKHLPEAIIDALDLNLSLPGYNVTVNEPSAIQAQLVAALKDITGDICERFDMESSSTNPGIKNCVENARAALAAAGAQS